MKVKFMLLLSFHRFVKVLFLICLTSCNSREELHNDIQRMKTSHTKVQTQLFASDVISEIEYVALETNPQCLIGERTKVSVSENHILVYSRDEVECFLFSREGKFIRRIGEKGNGPEDYNVNDDYYIKIDEKTGMIYLIGRHSICSYRITGEFFKKLNLNELLKALGISIFFRIHLVYLCVTILQWYHYQNDRP